MREERVIYEDYKLGKLEEILRSVFDKAVTEAFAEMDRQAKENRGDSFELIAEVRGETGLGFKMTLEVFPPTIPMIPSQN